MAYIAPNSFLRIKTKSETGITTFATKHVLGIVPSAEVPDPTIDVKQFKNLGTGRTLYHQQPGHKAYEGTIPLVLTEAWPLKLAFGLGKSGANSYPQRGTTLTGYLAGNTITYKPVSDAHLPAFEIDAILRDSPGLRRRYFGCMVNTLELSGEEDGELRAQLGLMAADADSYDASAGGVRIADSGGTDDTVTSNPTLDFSNETNFPIPGTGVRPWMFYDASIQILGSPICSVKSFNIGLNNNLASRHYFCEQSDARKKGNPNDIFTAFPEYTAEAQIVADNTPAGVQARSIFNQLIGSQSTFDIVCTFTKPTVADPTKTIVLTITAKDCILESAPYHIPEENEVDVPVVAKPRFIQVDIVDNRTDANIASDTGASGGFSTAISMYGLADDDFPSLNSFA